MMKATLTLAAILLSAGWTMNAAFADGPIKVEQAWARATPGGAKTGAVYLTVTNTGTTPDTLVGAATPAADKAELHEMKMQNNIMEMRPISTLSLAPGQSVTLGPNGYHIMLVGLKAPLKEGDTLPITLSFQHAPKQDVTVPVMKLGAMGPAASGSMNGMPGMSMPSRQR